jgi:hypothetical protein
MAEAPVVIKEKQATRKPEILCESRVHPSLPSANDTAAVQSGGGSELLQGKRYWTRGTGQEPQDEEETA